MITIELAVAAALKKIAAALFSERKVVKKTGIFILSILAGVLMPMGGVFGLFSGKIEFSDEQIIAIGD